METPALSAILYGNFNVLVGGRGSWYIDLRRSSGVCKEVGWNVLEKSGKKGTEVVQYDVICNGIILYSMVRYNGI